MKLNILVCLTWFGCNALSVFGQIDSVRLDSTFISVRGNAKHPTIDSFYVSNADFVSEVLTQQALVFVKPTGGTALSTVSVRGGTPEQSAVLWNGLSLQNTLNGNVDLNLLPGLVFDEIAINNTNAVRTGSGATAGSIELNNSKLDSTSSLYANVGNGSFGLYNIALKATGSIKSSRYSLVTYVQQSTNNYPVPALISSIEPSRLQNASYKLAGLLYQQRINFKTANPLNLRLWVQTADRNIPATQLESESKKNQQDASIRLQSDWSKQFKKNEVKFVLGSFLETLSYNDSLSDINANYMFVNNSLLIHATRRLNKHIRVGLDIEARHFGADADTFYQQTRLETSQGGHIKTHFKKWDSHVGMRMVQFSGSEDYPVLLSTQVSRKIKRKWLIHGSFATNYRMPTFNSLYWNPGGNPDLVAERSRNGEVSIQYKSDRFNIYTTGFSNYISDQIRWLPGATGIFEAQQIADQVQWNRGVEVAAKYRFKHIILDAGATKLASTVLGDENQWQQSFVPTYQSYSNITYWFKNFMFRFGSQFVSKRFTDVENTEEIEDYLIHRAQFTWSYRGLKTNLIVRNLGNLTYAVLPFRPNPPRNYQIDISYTINKNQKK